MSGRGPPWLTSSADARPLPPRPGASPESEPKPPYRLQKGRTRKPLPGLGLDRLQRRFLAEGAPEASAGVSSLYRSGCGLAVVKVRLATGAKNLRKRSKRNQQQ